MTEGVSFRNRGERALRDLLTALPELRRYLLTAGRQQW